MTLNALCAFDIMPYIVDIIVVALMLLFVFICAKKGFITCFFEFISTIGALFIAFSFASLFASITGGLFGLQGVLETSLVGSFSNLTGFDIPLDPSADLTEMLASQDMSEVLVNLIAQNWGDADIAGKTLAELAGYTVAEFATAVIAGVALFIILKLVFMVLKKFFNFLFKGGLLGTLNRLLGAAIGLVEAVLIASLVVTVLSLFPGMMSFLNGSIILTALYQFNPLMWLITLFLTL